VQRGIGLGQFLVRSQQLGVDRGQALQLFALARGGQLGLLARGVEIGVGLLQRVIALGQDRVCGCRSAIERARSAAVTACSAAACSNACWASMVAVTSVTSISAPTVSPFATSLPCG
jgi:hypothetical protein